MAAPLSTDEEAERERREVDYTTRITREMADKEAEARDKVGGTTEGRRRMAEDRARRSTSTWRRHQHRRDPISNRCRHNRCRCSRCKLR